MNTKNEYDPVEEEFIHRLKCGDNSAWADMFDRFDPVINKMARQRLESKYIGDVIQDVHINLFRTIHRYDSSRSALVTWVMLLTRRKCIDQLRKNRRDKLQVSLEHSLGAPNSDRTHSYEDIEERNRIISYLDCVSPIYEPIMRLVYQRGFKPSQAQEILKIPSGTAKTHLSRGLDEIRKKLGKEKREKERVTDYR